MSINIETETEIPFDFDYQEVIRKVVEHALEDAGCPYEAEVNVVLTDNESIQEVNREYRGIDAPTDVLSFPMIEYEEPGDFSPLESDDSLFHPDTGELLLGDIMISVDRVTTQAQEYGHSRLRELAFLTAHSMLHLFGYDHMEENERQVMEEKQRQLLDDLSIGRDEEQSSNDQTGDKQTGDEQTDDEQTDDEQIGNEQLIKMAEKAMGQAYAPYSHFQVGAALLTTDGTVFTGCNVENASYGATICAERCAVTKAVSEGITSFQKIAIVSSGGGLTFPCGICRQVLSEFMPNGVAILKNDQGKPEEYPLSGLLPHCFSLSKENRFHEKA